MMQTYRTYSPYSTRTLYVCALCDACQPAKKSNIQQHVWRKHADRHGGDPTETFRAEPHKKLVEPYIKEADINRNTGRVNQASMQQFFRDILSRSSSNQTVGHEPHDPPSNLHQSHSARISTTSSSSSNIQTREFPGSFNNFGPSHPHISIEPQAQRTYATGAAQQRYDNDAAINGSLQQAPEYSAPARSLPRHIQSHDLQYDGSYAYPSRSWPQSPSLYAMPSMPDMTAYHYSSAIPPAHEHDHVQMAHEPRRPLHSHSEYVVRVNSRGEYDKRRRSEHSIDPRAHNNGQAYQFTDQDQGGAADYNYDESKASQLWRPF